MDMQRMLSFLSVFGGVWLIPLISTVLATPSFAESDELYSSRKFRALQMISESYSPKIAVRRTSLNHKASCRLEEFRVSGMDPVDRKSRAVRVRSFRSFDKQTVERAVIIVPSIIGTTTLENTYAEDLCRRGVRALIIDEIQRDVPIGFSISSYDPAALRKLTAVRHITEFLYAAQVRNIGILGTSQGALVASLALGVESKIKSAAIIAGGGDLAQIVVDSAETSQAALREERMRKLGYRDRGEYLRALRAGIVINNLDFVGFTGHKPVWMSVVVDDTVVPAGTQRALRQALRPVSVVEYSGDHISGIVKTFVLSRQSLVEFFASTL